MSSNDLDVADFFLFCMAGLFLGSLSYVLCRLFVG